MTDIREALTEALRRLYTQRNYLGKRAEDDADAILAALPSGWRLTDAECIEGTLEVTEDDALERAEAIAIGAKEERERLRDKAWDRRERLAMTAATYRVFVELLAEPEAESSDIDPCVGGPHPCICDLADRQP